MSDEIALGIINDKKLGTEIKSVTVSARCGRQMGRQTVLRFLILVADSLVFLFEDIWGT